MEKGIFLLSLCMICFCTKPSEPDTDQAEYVSEILSSINISGTITLNRQSGDDEIFHEIASIGSFDDESDYMFGEIGAATLVLELLYVLDSRSKQIRIYDIESLLHVNSIDLEGRGPGETLYPIDLLINPVDSTLVILDRLRKVSLYKIDGYELTLSNEAILDKIPEAICESDDFYIVRFRHESGIQDQFRPMLSVDKSSLMSAMDFGKGFTNGHRLLSSQISRGRVACAEDQVVYSINEYLPIMNRYHIDEDGSVDQQIYLIQNAQLIATFSEEGLPELGFNNREGDGIFNNIKISDHHIILQHYNRSAEGDAIIQTHFLNKTDYQQEIYTCQGSSVFPTRGQ